MTSRARNLAERCFAVARSTAFPGERDAAIARGIAIAAKAGLALDLFDIPGRNRSTRPDMDALRATLRQFRKQEARMAAAAAAVSGLDARHRSGADQQRARWPHIGECASFVFSRGVPVYDLGGPDEDGFTWFCPTRDRRLTDGQLRALADEIAGRSFVEAAA